MTSNLKKIPITAIISVKNEALNLPHCLKKLDKLDQIIVVDSGSSDDTITIAEKMGAEVLQFKWNGKFPKKRNWTLQNADIKHDWVLFLDADEFVTDAFIDEINAKVSNPNFNGYTIQFENYFMGKKLRFGHKLQKNALFRKSKGAYERIDEDLWSHLDMEVHEHPIIEGKIGVIKNKVVHKDFKSLEHYIAKHNSYSSWEAHRINKLKEQKSVNMPRNQKIKYLLIKLGIAPIFHFITTYFIFLGFLDGKKGYIFAKYKSHYFFQIMTKLNELNNLNNN
jgi:glycosyltransferase involved in cell wall biosynthesis